MMNKILIVFLLLSGGVHAQKAGYKLMINPSWGYDLNLIKSPKYFESAGTADSSLWINAPNTGLGMRLLRFSDKKRHLLDGTFNVKKSIISPAISLQASDVQGGLAYRYKGPKWLENQFKVEVKRFVRSGAEDQDNLFGQPLTYGKMTVSNLFSAKLTKKWAVDIKPYFIHKNYHNEQFELFKYQDAGVFSNLKFKKKKKRWVEYSLYSNLHWRNYDILKEVEADGEEEEFETEEEMEEEFLVTNRNWAYLEGGFGYKVSLNKTSKLSFKARVVKMEDLIQQRLGYVQKGIQIKYSNKYKKWKNAVSLSVNQRDYTHFSTMFNGQQELLQYTYIKCLSSLKYQIKPNLNMCAKYGVRGRLSNVNDESSRYYRSYFMSEFSLGIQWVITGNKKGVK